MRYLTAVDPAWPFPRGTGEDAATADAVVLAGDRHSPDPVATAAGTTCKVTAPVAGQPMLERVTSALSASGVVAKVLLCGPGTEALHEAPAIERDLAGPWLDRIDASSSPSASALAALEARPHRRPVLVTTGDHALLTAEMVAAFTAAADDQAWDAAVALAPYHLVHGRYPEARPTATRFRHGAACGCNLFSLRTPDSRRLIELWARLEQRRKHPWRTIAGAVGARSLADYALGRLTIERALERLSCRLGIRVGAVMLPFAAAGLDVDTVADWQLADRIARGADT